MKTKFRRWFRKLSIAEVATHALEQVDRDIYLSRMALREQEATLAYHEARKKELQTLLQEHTATGNSVA